MRASLFYYVLLPLILVATLLLGYFSIRTAMRFGQWGEESIVESTLFVAREKVDRIERIIIENDNTFFNSIDLSNLPSFEEKSERLFALSRTVSAVLVIDDNGDIVMAVSRKGHDDATRIASEFTQSILKDLELEDSLNFHKHLHKKYEKGYRLISYISRLWQDERFTICLLNDFDYIRNAIFPIVFMDLGKDRVFNVEDNEGAVIFGETLTEAGEFSVSVRFPTTLYAWRVQLAPREAALFKARSQQRRISEAVLITISFGVIVLGMVVLSLAAVRERRLNRLKSEFISNVSHELKTPLSLIKMFSELMLMPAGARAPKEKKYLDIIMRESERLGALIENVLDFNRMERGQMGFDFQKSDPAGVVERSLDMYRFRLEQEGVDVRLEIQPDLPQVLLDEQALALAIINLLDNAVKYGRRGAEPIQLKVESRNGQVLIHVQDHGSGIQPSDLRRIFERFYRSTDLEVRRQRGSGIGLTLVKSIIEAHGGKVEVSSEPGHGATFTISIPVAD